MFPAEASGLAGGQGDVFGRKGGEDTGHLNCFS